MTYSDSRKPPLGIILNYFILLAKLRTISQIDVSLPVPSALLSVCIVGDRGGTTLGRPRGASSEQGPRTVLQSHHPQTELGCWLSQGNAGWAASLFGLAARVMPFTFAEPDHLLNIYLSQRLFSYPQESRLSGQLFPFGRGSQWGMRMTPSPFRRGLNRHPVGSVIVEEPNGTRGTHDLLKDSHGATTGTCTFWFQIWGSF